MADDAADSQLPTPITPPATGGAGAAETPAMPGPSGSAGDATTAAAAGSSASVGASTSSSGGGHSAQPAPPAPHAAFPTATDLMGPPPPPSASGSSAVHDRSPLPVPATPDQLFDMIRGTNARNAHIMLGVLDALAGGPIMPPMCADRPRATQPPSKLLLLPGLNFEGLPDDVLWTGTLGFLYVLTARFNIRGDHDPVALLESAARFCQVADPAQLNMVLSRVAEFAWSFLRYAQLVNRVDFAVGPLGFLLRNTNQGTYFNPVHAVFLEACLYARKFDSGLNYVTSDYINAHEGTSYLDVLIYHHHAGTLCAVNGQFDRATAFFTFAVAMHTSSVSAVQVACAKRAILCELLSTGRQLQFPKDTGNAVNRVLEKGIPEYMGLAKAFASKDWKAARDAANAGGGVFADDGNLGLVHLILGSITKRRILNLRKTYSRMTVADLAAKVQLSGQEGEQTVVNVIQGMLANKEIRATLSSSDSSGVVTFLEYDDYASPENMAKLKEAQQLSVWLHAELQRGNRAIGLNKKWLSKQARFIESKDKNRPDPSRKGTFDPNDDIGPAPIRGVGSNLADMGF